MLNKFLKLNVNMGMAMKNVKREELNAKIVSAVFNTIVKKRIANTYTFSNFDINKFFLLLLKGIYTYE